MEYQIVDRTSKIELEKEVRALIKKGWRPQGGIHVYRDVLAGQYAQMMVFVQAMVKE